MRRSAVGATLVIGLLAGLGAHGCGWLDTADDCAQNPILRCGPFALADAGTEGGTDGGDGGTDGGEGGPPPTCIPSENTAAVADTCGVFVSSSKGSDTTGKGTQEAPYATLGKALAEAKGQPVYACGEAFNEAVTVSATVKLYGALTCAKDWAYDASTKTSLTAGADDVPLTLTSAASGSSVYDFAITAADAKMEGGSSTAVVANGVMASFARVDIASGKGQEGTNGTTPTSDIGPTDPTDTNIVGNNGAPACMDPAMQFGGSAKDNPLCPSATGGPLGGAGGVGAVNNGSNGDLQPMASAQTALGGVGQPNTDPMNMWSCAAGNGGGTTGINGGSGIPGSGAQMTDLGTIDASGTYTGIAGQPGGTGKPGQGGGGGGGTKGKTMCAGASGGSGGAGGCGGNGGTSGLAGGASFGIVSLGATLSFDTVTIKPGAGGKGGDGGAGQGGATGGNGGNGGNGSANGLSNACNGGAGGQGGPGGKGGGGRGGHAIGIAYTGTVAPSTKGVTFTKGTAGAGGTGDNSMTGIVGDGAPGVVADVQAFP